MKKYKFKAKNTSASSDTQLLMVGIVLVGAGLLFLVQSGVFTSVTSAFVSNVTNTTAVQNATALLG